MPDLDKDHEIKIIPYNSAYKDHFKQLNEEWIKKYFSLEEEDHKILNDPDRYIIREGGYIFLAFYKGVAVGTCALSLKEDKVYELSKMWVTPGLQGKNIGRLLCETAIQKAKEMGASKVYLETNSRLGAAIHLYNLLGFKDVVNYTSKYHRVDIKMELVL